MQVSNAHLRRDRTLAMMNVNIQIESIKNIVKLDGSKMREQDSERIQQLGYHYH